MASRNSKGVGVENVREGVASEHGIDRLSHLRAARFGDAASARPLVYPSSLRQYGDRMYTFIEIHTTDQSVWATL